MKKLAMPARVTRARARRPDENQPLQVLKSKVVTNTKKTARAPLADRTNSGSDENTPGHDGRKKAGEVEPPVRPRRAQRVPKRLADHEIAFTPPRLNNASLEKDKVTPEEKKTSISPFKSPKGDSSIVAARPRRIQRLPSRFCDHSFSPSQFVELKPAWASTPLPPKEKVTSGNTRSTRILSNDSPLPPKEKVTAGKTRSERILSKDSPLSPKEKVTAGKTRSTRILSNDSPLPPKEKVTAGKTRSERISSKDSPLSPKEKVTAGKTRSMRIISNNSPLPPKEKVTAGKTRSERILSKDSPLSPKEKVTAGKTRSTRILSNDSPLPPKEKVTAGKTRSTSISNNDSALPPKEKVTSGKTRSKRILSKDKPKDKKADSNNNRQRKGLESVPVTKAALKPSSALKSPRKPPAKPLTLVTSPKKPPAQLKPLIVSPRKRRARVANNYAESSINENSSIFQTNRKESAEIKKKLAIYEFTFDPSEEPDVSKKRRKKQTVRRKAAPRRVLVKDNYSKNVAKQLESLKSMIFKKSASCTVATQTIVGNSETASRGDNPMPGNTEKTANIAQPIASAVSMKPASNNAKKFEKTTLQTRNTEQITNGEPQVSTDDAIPPTPEEEYHDDIPISYSPISTPCHVPEAMDYESTSMEPVYAAPSNPAQKKDPLNLIEELSFFDDVPVASSSLMSVRKSVGASPWRVECNVHNKWPVNMYVKSNMTPAYERSFTNFDVDFALRNNDKPVNTALFTDREADGLKQTSILSFISEVANKKAHKTPIKHNSLFDGSHSSNSHTSADQAEMSSANIPEIDPSKVANNESPASTRGIEPLERASANPEKDHSSHKEDMGVSKCFGFDDSEDRENISPKKPFPKFVGDRILRTRIALKEINQPRPMRLNRVPANAFPPSSAVVNEMYEKIKSAQDNVVAPQAESMEEKSLYGEKSSESNEASVEGEKKSESPVALFEDVEIVHHDKPIRKSYAKTRKVAFQQTASTVMNEMEDTATSDDEDDMTFAVPKVKGIRAPKRKKKKKVQKMSEKESEEAKAWVAGFNSMIEEAEEFDLVIE